MDSILQSSLYGMDFIKYRKNNSQQERKQFSNTVRTKGIGEIPIVIDSVDMQLSQLLAGADATRFKRNGKEFHFHQDLIIDEIILEIRSRIKLDNISYKILKLGLENGKILEGKDILGDLYKKFKNQDDNILYLLLTQETTMYSYILTLLRFVFGENFMKNS